ncbi:hypothetical protein C9I99_23885 [Photobacterium lutimaris]|uniref:Uncharacterized protein n=1 Tax=Photobacterium lutimaris TaxID=388278 RepID=A0A2T3IPA0_9GAMM|nr:hypothetical protein C9I99_23885 [Photobacterium lutimaris]
MAGWVVRDWLFVLADVDEVVNSYCLKATMKQYLVLIEIKLQPNISSRYIVSSLDWRKVCLVDRESARNGKRQ